MKELEIAVDTRYIITMRDVNKWYADFQTSGIMMEKIIKKKFPSYTSYNRGYQNGN